MGHIHVELLVERESRGTAVQRGVDGRVGGVDVLVGQAGDELLEVSDSLRTTLRQLVSVLIGGAAYRSRFRRLKVSRHTAREELAYHSHSTAISVV